jgi:hypothetical protein
MTSWTNPETLTAIIGAFAALVTAIGVTWHSINTRQIANAANKNSVAATANAKLALVRTSRLTGPAFPQGGVPVRPDLPPDNSDKNN